MKTALLIIDVQQVFWSGEHKAFDVEAVVTRINKMAQRARSVGAPIIFIQHETASGPLEFNSVGWQLAQGLKVQSADHWLRKTASDSFCESELQNTLNTLQVLELVVCGIQSDFCVDSTTRRAMALGYNVQLVQDAHTSLANGVLSAEQIIAHHNVTLSNLTSFEGKCRLVWAADVVFL